jgi:mRNA (guanine-N7-)-methyltransferase
MNLKKEIVNFIPKFHNWIKKSLIHESVEMLREKGFNKISLLDLATGKAGDLHKWVNAGIDVVYGVDCDEDALFGTNGALNRLLNMKNYYRSKGIKYPFVRFGNIDLSKKNSLEEINKFTNNKKFELITCNFAVHYFYETDEMFSNFMSIVGHLLKPGGIFIGTSINGKEVIKILKGKDKVSKRFISIKSEFTKKLETNFGNKYIISIGDKDDNHYFTEKDSKENDMKYICKIPFIKWYNLYLNETYDKITKDEKDASFLNMTFYLEKNN